MTDPLLTLVARALYEDWVAEDFANEYAGWDQLADKQTWLGRAQAALSVIREQEGTVTEAMIEAGARKLAVFSQSDATWHEYVDDARACYTAMHAARPLPAPPLEKL